MKKLTGIFLTVILLLTYQVAMANEGQYLFDIKLYDITKVGNGVVKHENLEAYTNPKLLVQINQPAFMKISSESTDEMQFELKLIVRSKDKYDLEYKLFKDKKIVSGPIKTEGFSVNETWLMITNFDGKKVLISVDARNMKESN
ncbi:hypothetical protein DZA50_05815 [Kangiella sp. HD9-110m-PIT-SAG07]|nr:hypothetical protein DZA50_05815 [Kangiella sp. HD9-110m-PIT-SAG07]